MNNEEKNNLVDLSLKDVKKLYFASVMTKVNFYIGLILSISHILAILGWDCWMFFISSHPISALELFMDMCWVLCINISIFLMGYIPLRYRSLTTKYYYLISSLIGSFFSFVIVVIGFLFLNDTKEAQEDVLTGIVILIMFSIFCIFNLLLFLPTINKYFWGKEVLTHDSIKKLYNAKLKEENPSVDDLQYTKTSHIKSVIFIILSWALSAAAVYILMNI